MTLRAITADIATWWRGPQGVAVQCVLVAAAGCLASAAVCSSAWPGLITLAACSAVTCLQRAARRRWQSQAMGVAWAAGVRDAMQAREDATVQVFRLASDESKPQVNRDLN